MSVNTNYYNYSDMLFGNTNSSSPISQSNMYNLLSESQSASMNSYKQNTAESLPENTKTFLSDAKIASEDLKASLQSLLGKTKTGATSFDEKTAVSSDTDYLAIKSVDNKKADLKESKVDIEQIALAQKNEGKNLSAKVGAGLSGYQTFEIESEGKKTAVSFRVSAADTNETAQQKMADAINSKNLGINAKVTTEKDSKGVLQSKLVLESSKTGVNNAGKDNFNIRDLAGSEAVSAFDVGTVDQKAQNAKFSVNNGITKESKTNDVDLGNGVTATLKKATTSEVSVKMGKDTLGSLNQVREMVNGFNALYDAANENKNDRRTGSLLSELRGMSSSYGMSLNRIGISTTEEGFLKIDEKKMKTAADSGELEKFFTSNGKNSSYGFANRLERTAENVSNKTTDYVSNQKITNNDYFSPKQTAQYNQLLNTGLLFSAFI